MNKYEKPDLEIILLESENSIIYTSGKMEPDETGGYENGNWTDFI